MGEFVIYAEGHKNIRATHKTTWQITRENELTPKGDCIIGVRATSSTSSLPPRLKAWIQSGGELQYTISILASSYTLRGNAWGHKDLSLDHDVDIVVRKSDFISSRTLALNSSLVAADIPKSWIPLLQNPETKLEIRFSYSDAVNDQ